jgi:hypothetical protein
MGRRSPRDPAANDGYAAGRRPGGEQGMIARTGSLEDRLQALLLRAEAWFLLYDKSG